MKNIVKTTILVLLFIGIISCEESRDPVVVANGFELRKDATVSSPSVLTEGISADDFAKFEWDASDNGPATVATYTLQVFDHSDTSYANPVEYTGDGLVVTPSVRTATLTVAEFNKLLNDLPTFKCTEMDVDVRIKSTLGGNSDNAFIQYSNVVNVKVTGYSLTLPILALVKDGDTASAAPTIAASAPSINTNYEGYMYLEAGNYKFYKPDACGDFTSAAVYGGTAGVLDTSSTPVSIVISTAGHYLVKANLSTNTYTLSLFTTFGIFGTATRTGLGFGNQVPFDYNATTKIWSLEIDLLKGKKFKFKSNLWTGALVVPALPNPPYAPGTATTSVSILGKTAIPLSLAENNVTGSGDITVPGTDDGTRDRYRIELDVSSPRMYTYKMTKI